MAGYVVVALLGAGVTYVVTQRAADARVLEMRTQSALELADCREQSAAASLERTACEAQRRAEAAHEAPAIVGGDTVDATVSGVSGAAPVARGTACRVELDWNTAPMEGCRALVRCGEARLYGDVGTGFFGCTIDEHGFVHGQDAHPSADGGDPRLSVDGSTRRMTLSDEGPDWSVTLELPEMVVRDASLDDPGL